MKRERVRETFQTVLDGWAGENFMRPMLLYRWIHKARFKPGDRVRVTVEKIADGDSSPARNSGPVLGAESPKRRPAKQGKGAA